MSIHEQSDDFVELFDLQASMHDYDPTTDELLLRQEPGVTETFDAAEKAFVLERGYSLDEFTHMARLAIEEVLEMRRELSQLDPDSFL